MGEASIRRAVRTSDVVVVCLSSSAVTKSGYLQKEIRIALDIADEQPEGKVFVIPVRLEDCSVPERLCHWQWVNLFEPNGYQHLLKGLRGESSRLDPSILVPRHVGSPSSASTRPAPAVLRLARWLFTFAFKGRWRFVPATVVVLGLALLFWLYEGRVHERLPGPRETARLQYRPPVSGILPSPDFQGARAPEGTSLPALVSPVQWSTEHSVPVMVPGGRDDAYGVAALAVCKRDEYYYMCYIGEASNTYGDRQMEYALSTTGWLWDRKGMVSGLPSDEAMAGIYVDGGRYVAVFADGKTYRSANGQRWTPADSIPAPGWITCLAERNGKRLVWYYPSIRDLSRAPSSLGCLARDGSGRWVRQGDYAFPCDDFGARPYSSALVWDGARWVAFVECHVEHTVFGWIEYAVAADGGPFLYGGKLIPTEPGRTGRRTDTPIVFAEGRTIRLWYSAMEENGNAMSILHTQFYSDGNGTHSLGLSQSTRALRLGREKQWEVWDAIDKTMRAMYTTGFCKRGGIVDNTVEPERVLTDVPGYTWHVRPGELAPGGITAVYEKNKFRFVLAGNVDGDTTLDVWVLTEEAFRREGSAALVVDDCEK